MKNIACFNELSVNPLCSSKSEAVLRVRNFIKLIKKIREHTNITKIRYDFDLTQIPLTENMSVQDYCNENIHDPYAISLLSMFVNPYVDMADDENLEQYFSTTTEIHLNDEQKMLSAGFNAAYCQSTFCVGFDSEAFWEKDFFKLSVTSNNKVNEVNWACISSFDFYSDLPVHKHRKKDFDTWLQSIRPVTLVSSTISPADKHINLRNDHGKDILTEHAKLLRNNPYVESILTSLSFQPHHKSYIYKIYADGMIDIVLYWDDRGLSMRIKTTGRNIAETKEIAAILTKRYGKP